MPLQFQLTFKIHCIIEEECNFELYPNYFIVFPEQKVYRRWGPLSISLKWQISDFKSVLKFFRVLYEYVDIFILDYQRKFNINYIYLIYVRLLTRIWQSSPSPSKCSTKF